MEHIVIPILIVAVLVLVALYIRLVIASKKYPKVRRCGYCQHWVRHNPKGLMGTCFCRGFNHGVDKPEYGYCDRARAPSKKE